MRQNNGSIRVPWPHRIRYLLANQLQGWLFALSVVAVLALWFRQSPRVIVTGQVEMVQVVVPATRDGVLKITDHPLARFDRVIQGVTPVARLDVTQALLTMQSLTAERERLQAELESQREQIRQEQLKWKWQSDQQQRELERQAIDRNRVRLALRQIVDQLTADVNDLQQNKRVLAIKHQEYAAAIRKAEIEIQSLGDDRKRLERLIAMRMTPGSQMVELDQRLKLQEEALQSAKKLEQMITLQIVHLNNQTLESSKRLAVAKNQSGDSEIENQSVVDTSNPVRSNPVQSNPVQSLDVQAMLQPYVEAIAVQDARIRVVANQITSDQIVAPASGTIAKIHHPGGTFVKSGDPIVTIASDQRRWVVAYLNAADQAKVRPDAPVQIRITGPHTFVTTSSVAERGNHFESVPPELRRNADAAQWGVPIKVPLPAGVDVVPGQTVQLVIQ